MRGRKPQPTALKLLRGFPGKRKPRADEPAPVPLDEAPPPDWLAPEAQAEWIRLAPQLIRLGVLTESDTGALAAYCEAWATWKEATRQIRKFGMVLKGDGVVPVVSPFVKIADKSLTQMRSFLIEFGLTPSSRVRIHATKGRPHPDASTQSKWGTALL
jgi:P27 family predicted phage terminase small subunit